MPGTDIIHWTSDALNSWPERDKDQIHLGFSWFRKLSDSRRMPGDLDRSLGEIIDAAARGDSCSPVGRDDWHAVLDRTTGSSGGANYLRLFLESYSDLLLCSWTPVVFGSGRWFLVFDGGRPLHTALKRSLELFGSVGLQIGPRGLKSDQVVRVATTASVAEALEKSPLVKRQFLIVDRCVAVDDSTPVSLRSILESLRDVPGFQGSEG